MLKKGQNYAIISLVAIVILGLLIVILVFLFSSSSNRQVVSVIDTEKRENFDVIDSEEYIQNSINECIDVSIIENLPETGIRESTKAQLESLVQGSIKKCTDALFEQYKGRNFKVNIDPLYVSLKLDEESIVAKVSFHILFQTNFVLTSSSQL